MDGAIWRLVNNRAQHFEVATKHRLPATAPLQSWADAGPLIIYTPDVSELYTRAAVYVDKVLKGAKPADLPVERTSKFELIINLTTARALGLTIPPPVLQQATEVIQ